MITADADLEADLGIDSLKRAEMLTRVATLFNLGEAARDGRFLQQYTIEGIAGLISELNQ
jgi:hypothetical protein